MSTLLLIRMISLRTSKILSLHQHPPDSPDLLQIDRISAICQDGFLNALNGRGRRHVEESRHVLD